MSEQHRADIRRGRRLEWFTVGWNALEAVISLAAGGQAGSAALIGFGLDSGIESLSGMALLWRLREGERGERREQTARKLVALSLFALAAYVAYDAIQSLLIREPPETSPVGIGLAVLSLLVMPILARAKRRVARRLNSRALTADSRQTDLCAYLSAILLAGLALNALFGWWWADPAAALLMLPILLKEGVEAWRGELCGDCH